jgi:uncharacterized UPF0160 family protein
MTIVNTLRAVLASGRQVFVGTHSGPFHADDVVGVAVLKVLFGEENVLVIRSRDVAVLAGCDVRVDVGAKSDPDGGDFDHHQGGLTQAAAGLVMDAFGAEAFGVVGAGRVRALLADAVDALDQGVNWTGSQFALGGVGFSEAVSLQNPTWLEGEDFDGRFAGAVDLAFECLLAAAQGQSALDDGGMVAVRQAARDAGLAAAASTVAHAVSVAADPRVVAFDKFVPWQDHLVPASADALFAVFPGPGGDCWMVQCVPDSVGSFGKRKALPSGWAGLRDVYLQDATGVADAVFCHPGLFIAGAGSKDSALRMAAAAADAQVPALV